MKQNNMKAERAFAQVVDTDVLAIAGLGLGLLLLFLVQLAEIAHF